MKVALDTNVLVSALIRVLKPHNENLKHLNAFSFSQ
jgi:predicted nucleic acid-binding protein